MPLSFDKDYLLLALNDLQWENEHGISFKRHDIGQIKITSGKLVACDPTWDAWDEEKPFTQTVPIGNFPVRVTIAHEDENDIDLVNFVAIRFDTEQLPVSWQMMLLDGQDMAELSDKEFFGYGVDGGTGCFMDYEVTKFLEKDESSEDITDDLMDIEEFWHIVNVDKGNIVAFNAGWGDGSYPTFAGFSADGKLVAVVTDFMCYYAEYHGIDEDDLDDDDDMEYIN